MASTRNSCGLGTYFKSNIEIIWATNAGNLTFTLGVNEFADLTQGVATFCEESEIVRLLLEILNHGRSGGCLGSEHGQSRISERTAVRGLRLYLFGLNRWSDGIWPM